MYHRSNASLAMAGSGAANQDRRVSFDYFGEDPNLTVLLLVIGMAKEYKNTYLLASGALESREISERTGWNATTDYIRTSEAVVRFSMELYNRRKWIVIRSGSAVKSGS